MPDERQFDSALVNLVAALGRGFEEFVASPAFAKLVEAELDYRQRHVWIDPASTIQIIGAPEPTELPQLRRIIYNASKAAGKLYLYADQQRLVKAGKSTGNKAIIRHRAAMRYAATSRDSLATMVKLLGGDVDEGAFTRTLDEMVVEDQTEVAAATPPSDEETQVKLAEVYGYAKRIAQMTQNASTVRPAHDVTISIHDLAMKIMTLCRGEEVG